MTTRPERIIVIADHTPGPHQTDTEDNWWWLPVIGPTATALAFLLARHAHHGERTWDTATLARTIGLAGNRNKLWSSLDRLSDFHVIHFAATDVITVRLYLPALTTRQLTVLPDDLAAAYRTLTTA